MTLRTVFAAALLALSFPAVPALSSDAEAVFADEGFRQALREEIRDYLLSNPDILVEMIAILESRQEQARVDTERAMIADLGDEIFNDGFSYVGGNPDGDVTLVEFLDYRCGFCRRAHPEVRALLNDDGEVRWIVKEFPILGEESVYASRMAIATLRSLGGDAYRTLHDVLMAFNGPINPRTLPVISAEAGLNPDVVQAAMQDPEVDAQIRAVRSLANAMQITGTPAFVVGDQIIRGFVPRDALQDAILAARKNGG
ncbi:MAG: DsbA family protein [Paracoccaceae bacterium]|nr:DsbA family protein [Paracoccaceae bacterium]MDE2915242.1 DsbA family protein [Paracoccaceae bacterium]